MGPTRKQMAAELAAAGGKRRRRRPLLAATETRLCGRKLSLVENVFWLTLVLISSSILLTPMPSAGSTQTSSRQLQHSNFQTMYSPGSNESLQRQQQQQQESTTSCTSGLLTFELSTGFIYKPTSAETLAMMPSTLQLTDCLDYCLHNASCLAINFEMGLCVLLSSSAKHNPQNLYSSQFPVFTIYAEKKCLLAGDAQAAKQKRRCQRAWTFERVAGYEMKTRPRRRLKLATKELCMEACLSERHFECRSANWYRLAGECTLSDQDRHSVSQSEAGDQQIKATLQDFYGPANVSAVSDAPTAPTRPHQALSNSGVGGSDGGRPMPASGLYQNYYALGEGGGDGGPGEGSDSERLAAASRRVARAALVGSLGAAATGTNSSAGGSVTASNRYRNIRQLFGELQRMRLGGSSSGQYNSDAAADWAAQYASEPLAALQPTVDYLENNCVYEPNKLCEFRKIQNRVLKTVDSIYQDVGSLEECKQKCLSAPYRCYSFDYGDTSERVCRTSHLDQASLLAVKEPYLEVVGAITYELAACFNVTIQCRAREMVAQVSSSKVFKGKIYAKSRPSSCTNDVRESLQFELVMRYHDDACDVRASSSQQRGVFSADIVIQHHDRIVTTQDVGLSVYCHYDLGNRSITTNNVDLAIERLEPVEPGGGGGTSMESKTQQQQQGGGGGTRPAHESGSVNSPLMVTGLATTVVRSPNVTMRITNMNGQPVSSATVGDRLALLFEIKETTSPFGIFVREIIAMDGKQLLLDNKNKNTNNNNNGHSQAGAGRPSGGGYHYAASNSTAAASQQLQENAIESMFQANKANSVQFIDSDGCPTDANIMGPLVKMDPAGHRILAPFDAFKFPTSDMVFFRAVVTSCISECKPAVCSSSSLSQPSATEQPMPSSYSSLSTSADLMLAAAAATGVSSTTTTSASTSNQRTQTTLSMAAPGASIAYTTTTTPTPISTTRTPNNDKNMQQQQPATSALPASNSQTQVPTTTTSSGAELRWTSGGAGLGPTSSASDQMLLKMTATTEDGSQAASGGDSLTTVAGFGGDQEPAWQPDSSEAGQLPPATLNSVVQREQQFSPPVSMANNHQQGKAPPRPPAMGAGGGGGNSGGTGEGGKPLPPFAGLDSLTSEQRDQLVKLFDTKLRQRHHHGSGSQNNGSGISDVAHLYAGFLTSIMLNGGASGGDSSELDNSNAGFASSITAQPSMGGANSIQGEEQLTVVSPTNDNNDNNNNNYKRHEATTTGSSSASKDLAGGDHQPLLREPPPRATDGVKLADFEGFLSYLMSRAGGGAAAAAAEDRPQSLDRNDEQRVSAASEASSGPTLVQHRTGQSSVINEDDGLVEGASVSAATVNQSGGLGGGSSASSVAAPASSVLADDLAGNFLESNFNDLANSMASNSTGAAGQLARQTFDRPSVVTMEAAVASATTTPTSLLQDFNRVRSQQQVQQAATALLAPAPTGNGSRVPAAATRLAGAKLGPTRAALATITTGKGAAATGQEVASNAAAAAAAEKQRKRDKANLQALADSYMGAFQSYGRRRRRRRQVATMDSSTKEAADGFSSGRDSVKEGEEEERGSRNSLSSGYIYFEQPQHAALAPSVVDQSAARFTQAVVEMYHTSAAAAAHAEEDDQGHNVRLKRAAPAPQPFYDMDEMVVQSIKIMDRLQFHDDHDEKQASKSPPLAGRRSGLVTGPTSTPQWSSRSAYNSTATSREQQQPRPGRPRQATAADEEDADASDDDGDDNYARSSAFGATSSQQQVKLVNWWASSSAFGLVLIALSFIFVQVFLVGVCLLDWHHRRQSAITRQRRRAALPPASPSPTMTTTDYGSSIRGSSTLASNRSSYGGGGDCSGSGDHTNALARLAAHLGSPEAGPGYTISAQPGGHNQRRTGYNHSYPHHLEATTTALAPMPVRAVGRRGHRAASFQPARPGNWGAPFFSPQAPTCDSIGQQQQEPESLLASGDHHHQQLHHYCIAGARCTVCQLPNKHL